MAAAVFYLDELPAAGQTARLDGPEGRHAATVRRFAAGDRLLLADTRGGVAECTVLEAGRDSLELTVDARVDVRPPTPAVTVVQALPKSERAELAVDLATEAGADRIVPWQAARCVSKWRSGSGKSGFDKSDKALAKWRATAREAGKQSRRAHVPLVDELHTTAMLVERVRAVSAAGALVLILHESAVGSLPRTEVREAAELMLIVGPEGGVDDSEVEALTAAGAHAVRLGPEVLRTSAAAAVALGAIGVLTTRWDTGPLELRG